MVITTILLLLVGGLDQFFFMFPYVGNNNPNLLICLRGVEATNQYNIYIYILVNL